MHSNNVFLQEKIRNNLKLYGIDVDENGQIHYFNDSFPSIQANAVYLLRHAETFGTQEHKFMSNNSTNAHLCEKGKMDISLLCNNLFSFSFDYFLVCCNLPRVIETAHELQNNLDSLLLYYVDDFYGINNGDWAGKNPQDLLGIDLDDYIEREVNKNIFAHSSQGTSWGEVLLNCINLIDYINHHCNGKRVLLISQGSVFQGLKILCHINSSPWEGYDRNKMYNFDSKEIENNYGKIERLYDKDL